MKFTVKREALLPLLTRVNNIIEKNSTQKIRTHILITANEGQLSLVGFDNEMKVSGSVPAAVSEAGAITVTSHTLFESVKSLNGQADIEISLHENSLHVIGGKSQIHLATMPAEDFPVPDDYQFDQQFALPASQLVDLFNQVKFSMASNDVRHYLNGLLLHVTPTQILAVSTDGHRLSVSEIANTFGVSEHKAIIPRKAVQELTSWLGGIDAELTINISGTHIQFVFGNLEMTSTLINAEYPAYETVIPEQAQELIIIPKDSLNQALNRAKIVSNEHGLGASLAFSPWELSLSAKNMDNESVDETLEINYNGKPIKTAFNINYLQNILSVIDNENITMSLQDGHSSCLIFDAEKENSRYIVMPMNI